MASQKKPQSKRKVELPDWSNEVKPSEDVMAMFYAPTGVPKPGPLIPILPALKPGIGTVEDEATTKQDLGDPVQHASFSETHPIPTHPIPSQPILIKDKQSLEEGVMN